MKRVTVSKIVYELKYEYVVLVEQIYLYYKYRFFSFNLWTTTMCIARAQWKKQKKNFIFYIPLEERKKMY